MSNLTARFPAAIAQPAPVAHWHDDESNGHVVQFYSDDSFLLDALTKFVGTALGAGDSPIVIATPGHVKDLAQRLRARGLDIAKSARCGRYVALDAAETLAKFMHTGQPDPELILKTVAQIVT